MAGHPAPGLVRAHAGSRRDVGPGPVVGRELREERERQLLRPGATLADGAGNRAEPEEPDDERTCFERDRDRIVHSTAFRRLAGKTQVVVYPSDHQRTRLTHALEVAQVATSIARAAGVNVTLADAIALGHDCGHGPGGHASEDAFDAFIPEGYEHGPWGADVVLDRAQPVRRDPGRHPQPLLVPARAEHRRGGDRQLGRPDRLLRPRPGGRHPRRHRRPGRPAGRGGRGLRPDPARAAQHLRPGRGRARSTSTVRSGMPPAEAGGAGRAARLQLRADLRPPGLAGPVPGGDRRAAGPGRVLRRPAGRMLPDAPDRRPGQRRGRPGRGGYVAGMTDRYAFDRAVELLGWDPARLPPSATSA